MAAKAPLLRTTRAKNIREGEETEVIIIQKPDEISAKSTTHRFFQLPDGRKFNIKYNEPVEVPKVLADRWRYVLSLRAANRKMVAENSPDNT